MKHFRLSSMLFAIVFFSSLTGCRDDKTDPTPEPEPVAERKGLYVLSEGLFNANNSSLSYYNYENSELVDDQFSLQNGRGLGDTANDIAVYGSKMYIVVNVSSTIEVVDAKTAKSIKQVDLKDNGVGRQPRYIVFDKKKAYISSYDGTVAVMDTATLQIEKFIKVGRNPEQMAVSNGKLYVANSGGLDYPNYDNSVSVIDLASETEIKKIEVVINPRVVAADAYGDVYVISTGNYGNVKSSMAIISSNTNEVKKQSEFSGGSMAINGDQAYITASGGKIKVYNVKTETLEKENFIEDGTKISSVYGVTVDSITGEVFVTDAKNYVTKGEVTCFDSTGTKKYTIQTGINPNKVVFVNK
jgi:YVTN family beta-propeller protein